MFWILAFITLWLAGWTDTIFRAMQVVEANENLQKVVEGRELIVFAVLAVMTFVSWPIPAFNHYSSQLNWEEKGEKTWDNLKRRLDDE